VFTGLLLARAVQRGTVTLRDPIEPVFPAGAPDWEGQSITLLDLATHSSGLPRMPSNLRSSDPRNPAAGYTSRDLADFMAAYSLPSAPGSRLLYSNLGAGVLGYVLVDRTGSASYEALVRSELAVPLAMVDTRIAVPASDAARMARGYRNAIAVPANEIGEPLAGGGALRSTGNDMLRFVEAALGIGDAPVVSAWTLALSPHRPSPQGVDGQMGLLIARQTVDGRFEFGKAGQTAGFTAFLALTPAPPAAVVVLANSSELTEDSVEALASSLLALLVD
jgi:CubicO group peptidase (beta-lactamase class C family)